MFKLAKKPTVFWPVTVKEPQDGGGVRKFTFDAEFAVLTQDEQEEAVRGGQDLLELQLIGWKSNLTDEHGQPFEFSEANKRVLLSITYVRAALFQAIGEFQNGQAARKN
jgi:hypothetical protein